MISKTPNKLFSLARQSPFIKHNTVFFAGSMVVAFLNYLYYPVLGRMLSPSDFGEVQAVTSIFLQVMIFLQVVSYVTIHVTVNYKSDKERNKVIFGLEKLASGLSIILAGLVIVFAPALQSFFQFSSPWPFFAFAVIIVFSVIQNFRVAFLRGKKSFGSASITGMITAGGKLLFAVILVYLGLSTFGAIAGIAIAQALAMFYSFYKAGQLGLKGISWHSSTARLKTLKPQFVYALFVLTISLSVMFMLSIDIIAVKHYFPPAMAGQYAGIVTIGRVVYFLTASIAGVMLSLIAIENSNVLNRRRFYGSAALTAALGGGAALIMSLFPEESLRFIVGAKYLEFAGLVPRLALAMFIVSMMNLVLIYNMSLRRYFIGALSIMGVFITVIMFIINHSSPADIVNAVLYGSLLTLVTSIVYTAKKELDQEAK